MNTKSIIAPKDQSWAKNYNAELFRRATEEKKERETALSKARIVWDSTPDSERVCTACGLRLSAVDIGRITENPTLPRRHEMCNPFDIDPGVVKGLVGLLREIYDDDEIPLNALEQVIEAWNKQRGFCGVARQVKLQFPIEEEPIKPRERPSSVSPIEHALMERQREKEWAERKRAGELHSPVIDYAEDGTLRLISKTVARMKDGLTAGEFQNIVHILYSELKPAKPARRF